MGCGLGLAVKIRGPTIGVGGAAYVEPTSLIRPRHGVAHQICIRWAATGPGPTIFSVDGTRPGPARHIFKLSRADPSRLIKYSECSARPMTNFGPDHRPMTSAGIFVQVVVPTSQFLLLTSNAYRSSCPHKGNCHNCSGCRLDS